MDKKKISMFLSFLIVVCTILGAVLLGISMFGDGKNNYIPTALFFVIVGNGLNLVRIQICKK
ncbi:MAG: hypothetical protein Q4C49_07565 [Bacillota bacterium]|nr:hypothetical protein [Bacillota bacterium]